MNVGFPQVSSPGKSHVPGLKDILWWMRPGKLRTNVSVSPSTRASKYRMLFIILLNSVGKAQAIPPYFMVRVSHRWQDKLEVML